MQSHVIKGALMTTYMQILTINQCLSSKFISYILAQYVITICTIGANLCHFNIDKLSLEINAAGKFDNVMKINDLKV